jgi:hypothetical protein
VTTEVKRSDQRDRDERSWCVTLAGPRRRICSAEKSTQESQHPDNKLYATRRLGSGALREIAR